MTDRRIDQSSPKSTLPFMNAFYGFFTEWICKINPNNPSQSRWRKKIWFGLPWIVDTKYFFKNMGWPHSVLHCFATANAIGPASQKEAEPILKGRFRPIVKPQVLKEIWPANLHVLFRLLSITLHNSWHARTIGRSQKFLNRPCFWPVSTDGAKKCLVWSLLLVVLCLNSDPA